MDLQVRPQNLVKDTVSPKSEFTTGPITWGGREVALTTFNSWRSLDQKTSGFLTLFSNSTLMMTTPGRLVE